MVLNVRDVLSGRRLRCQIRPFFGMGPVREALMTLQFTIELILVLAAVLLLARDLHRAWLDQLRRPLTLLIAALVTVLLAGALGGHAHPNPWWLVVPGVILVWEVRRGWRQTPRCHLWEAGVGAFAASLLLAVVGLDLDGGSVATALLATSVAAGIVGVDLLWRSRRREPRPWRIDDGSHYERRSVQRPRAKDVAIPAILKAGMPNPAFESGRTDKQRTSGPRLLRRAAQRERQP